MSTPAVLFVVFNRPDTTALVMEAIRRARPPRLYVAADGPRDRPGELERCLEARRIATDVDWPCEVKTLFRSENLRGPHAVSGAINWFFEHEEEGIILEDDCLPSQDFFAYCAELLDRYRMDRRVMSISGTCFTDKRFGEADFYSCYFADVWGWATWRRAWKLYDRHLSGWKAAKQSGMLDSLDEPVKAHWTRIFDAISEGRRDHWDYPWIFTVMQHDGVAFHPRVNLISNLGFRSDASNTRSRAGRVSRSPLAARALGQLQFPLRHPTTLERTPAFEDVVNRVRLGIPRHPRLAKARKWLSRGISAAPNVGEAARRNLPPEVLGVLDLLRFPSVKNAWGGPFNGQRARQRLVQAIIESVKPTAVVETGTFRGTTTAYIARYGLPVFTVDDDPRSYVFAWARLRATSNVKVLHSDSRAALLKLFEEEPRLSRDSVVLFYLDAHRSREDPSLPQELRTVFEHRPNSVVVLDDFQVPFDRGYGYNDFGPGKIFGEPLIAAIAREHDLCVFYPATPSGEETGARRGCAVVGKRGVYAASFSDLELLRASTFGAPSAEAT